MKITILGAGAYAVALASIFHKNGNSVTLWSHDEIEKKEIEKTRKSSKLKEYIIPKEIYITSNLEESIKDAKLIVIAIPAHAVEETTKKLSEHITKDSHILIATKGIENTTCSLMTNIIEKHINTNKIAVISGPTFATDIIKNSPLGLTLATTNNKTKTLIRSLIENSTVKLRTTKDIIGVQICGGIKNVMAIASGILEGMKVTDSTKALFLTEILNDIKDLIEELGGNKNTILSLAGFGDIILTCTSTNSRNFTYGKLIGEGKLKDAEDYAKNTTVEGLYTLESIKKLIERENIKKYIIELINGIITGTKDKKEILEFLIFK